MARSRLVAHAFKRGLVVSGTNQDALKAHFGDHVTGCFGKKVQFEPTLTRVASREHLTGVRVRSPGSRPQTTCQRWRRAADINTKRERRSLPLPVSVPSECLGP
jgi:hypothetical protein